MSKLVSQEHQDLIWEGVQLTKDLHDLRNFRGAMEECQRAAGQMMLGTPKPILMSIMKIRVRILAINKELKIETT